MLPAATFVNYTLLYISSTYIMQITRQLGRLGIPLVTFKRVVRKPATVTVVVLCPPSPPKKCLGTRRLGGPKSRSGLFIYFGGGEGNKFIPPSWIQIPDLRANSLVAIPITRQGESDLVKERLRWTGHVARVGKEQKLDLICP